METIKLSKDESRRPPRDEKPPVREGAASDSQRGRESAGEAPRTRSAPTTKAARADAAIREALLNLYGTIGLTVGGIGQMHNNPAMVAAGVNITAQAESVSDTWLELGRQVPAVRRMLESMLTGSAYATLVMGHIAMLAPVGVALGVIPEHLGSMFLAPEARAAGEAFAAMRQAQAAANNGHTN